MKDHINNTNNNSDNDDNNENDKRGDDGNKFKMLIWGSGSEGQLAQGEYNGFSKVELNDYNVPKLVNFDWDKDEENNNKKVIIDAGGNHTGVLFKRRGGKHLDIIYLWGLNENMELGIDTIENRVTIPLKLDYFVSSERIQIEEICCGWNFTLFRSNHGNIYSCGNNYFNQLGRNTTTASSKNGIGMVVFPNKNKIIKIATGLRHCLAIDEENNLFGWGNNRFNQLKIKDDTNEERNKTNTNSNNNDNDGKKKAKETGGKKSSGKSSGKSSSSNVRRKKIIQPKAKNIITPERLDIVVKTEEGSGENLYIQSIACGARHSYILMKNNHIYCIGDNKFGQLGLKDQSMKFNIIRKFTKEARIREIYSGWSFGMILLSNGDLYGIGRGDYGQLGNKSFQHSFELIHVSTLKNVEKLSLGSEHTLAMVKKNDGGKESMGDDNHRIFSWGWNEHGQLGVGDCENRCVPVEILSGKRNNYNVENLSCGGAHSILFYKMGVGDCENE